jgi:hypothetical protein
VYGPINHNLTFHGESNKGKDIDELPGADDDDGDAYDEK